MAKIETYSENTKSMLSLVRKDALEFVENYKAKTGEEKRFKSYLVLFSQTQEPMVIPEFWDSVTTAKKKGMYYIILSDVLLSPLVSYHTVKEVLGHEVAHYIDWNINGFSSHGEEFKRICVIGVNDESVHKEALNTVKDNSSIIEKIKKLLALSESPNMNEAQSALLKARQLMRDYNLEDADRKESQKIYRLALHEYKSYTAELATITYIVQQVSNVCGAEQLVGSTIPSVLMEPRLKLRLRVPCSPTSRESWITNTI